MNNEIKEILEHLSATQKINNGWTSFSVEECKGLYDYITNLQQEIEKLNDDKRGMLVQLYKANDNRDKVKQENENLKCIISSVKEDYLREHNELEDYKSRCEKASDKLGNYKYYSTPTEEQNSENEDIVDSALNILQNGSENDERQIKNTK